MNLLRSISKNVITFSRMFSASAMHNQWPLTSKIEKDTRPDSGKRLLIPHLPMLQPACGLKIKGRLRLRCKDCFYIRKEGRLYVMCPTFPRHKQAQMVPKEKYTWILTHAMQSKLRPY